MCVIFRGSFRRRARSVSVSLSGIVGLQFNYLLRVVAKIAANNIAKKKKNTTHLRAHTQHFVSFPTIPVTTTATTAGRHTYNHERSHGSLLSVAHARRRRRRRHTHRRRVIRFLCVSLTSGGSSSSSVFQPYLPSTCCDLYTSTYITSHLFMIEFLLVSVHWE